MGYEGTEPTLPLPVAATLLGIETSTLLFLAEEAALRLGPGAALSIGDFQALARHPDLLDDHGFAAHHALEHQRAEHDAEKRVLLGRLEELERRAASQRAEIESLRRSMLVSCAERDRLLERLTPRTAG